MALSHSPEVASNGLVPFRLLPFCLLTTTQCHFAYSPHFAYLLPLSAISPTPILPTYYHSVPFRLLLFRLLPFCLLTTTQCHFVYSCFAYSHFAYLLPLSAISSTPVSPTPILPTYKMGVSETGAKWHQFLATSQMQFLQATCETR